MDTKPLYDKLNAYVRKKQLKSTKQRDIIVKTFFDMHGEHVKIEDLLQAVRKHNAAIGYATVYRTLNLLVEAGIANQRRFNDGQSRFEIDDQDEHHDHLICTECGTIIEFHNDSIEKLQEDIARKYKFKLTRHKMELYGVCSDCKSASR